MADVARGFSSPDEAATRLEVLNPRGEIPPPPTVGINPRASSLDGKKIVLVDNGKFGANNFLDALADILKEKYPKATIVMYPKPTAQTITNVPKWYPTVKQQGDLFVFGVGDWGSCTWWGSHDTIQIEKSGMPGVYFITSEFIHDAKSAARDNGMPGVRILTLPAEKYYRARSNKEEAQPLATGAFDAMIDALTHPLTTEEAKPSPIERQREDGNVQVSGDGFLSAFEKVNELFLANRWADGLPIVPPTRDLVNAMLAGTTRLPQEIIGQVAPKNGTATIEKIAINAVMAGAKPEYFPVILAAMEGFIDKKYDLTHVQASTGSFTPVVIVDGPIAEELGFNSGIGMLGHGWRPNSTVGRALRLSLLNLGQTWPQVNDMALTGRFEAYTFFTFAEDTARSPWEPYHVNLGYRSEDSTVTVATSVTSPVIFGGGAVMPWTGQGVIESVVARIRSGGVVWPHAQTYILVLHPDCAVDLAKHGYTRKSLQEHLYEQTRVAYEKVAGPVFFGHDNEIDFIRTSIADGRIRPDRASVFQEALKPGGRIPVVQSPDDFHIVVAGGSPGYDLLFSYPGTNWANQTKRISGATLTAAGRN